MGSFYVLCILSLVLIIGSSEVAHGQDSADDYVNAHNAARSAVALDGFSIPNILWNATAAEAAQDYVNQHKDCKVDVSVGKGDIFAYGKNIAVSTKNISGADAVKLWVDEKPYYDHYGNTCHRGECRHYIQVVWSKSLELGCAKVRCDNGGTLVACIYTPPATGGSESPY
ncbi:pathogenesis-related protein 1-like [Vicia villosa]|uniref:pathogenesis-related protein 1-like n=1 Tax=Vicia villosa TaxID=3911 RepID=UPI00273B3AC3|nr:pathogenesis-related protein 1-like [Vicia villosa]